MYPLIFPSCSLQNLLDLILNVLVLIYYFQNTKKHLQLKTDFIFVALYTLLFSLYLTYFEISKQVKTLIQMTMNYLIAYGIPNEYLEYSLKTKILNPTHYLCMIVKKNILNVFYIVIIVKIYKSICTYICMLFPCLYSSLIHQVSDILSISCIIYTYMFFSPSLFPGYINCLLNHTHTHNIGYFRVSSFFLLCLQCRIILYCLKMLTISCSTMALLTLL